MAAALTPEERAKYMTWLSQAETSLHQLNIGGAVRVFVDQNGERIEYSAANRQGLRAYIMELKGLLGLPLGISGPMRVHPW